MCGLCGAVHKYHTHPISNHQLQSMRESMRHRGPDDAGEYLDCGIALASRRLAILDLSDRGHMPMRTRSGRFWIVYNGEVYNYRELRTTLESRGHTFRSNTDTEVLLNLYEEHGSAMLDRLNGMFAFAIWDTYERTLFLARDRLGIKPLYYILRGGVLYFASEIKAFLAAGIPTDFDQKCWEELLCFGYLAGAKTPYVGVEALPPGHFLLWRDGSIRIVRWWNLSERAQSLRHCRPKQMPEWFRDTFDSAVNLRRISEVPVGVLLSGGLDSSSVAASLARQAGSGVASFTVRFPDGTYDEGPLAQETARQWSLEYHELTVSPGELLDRLLRASWLSDGPLAHGSDLHLWAISEYARSYVTVLLSGEGGDETLAGYDRYQALRYPGLLDAARPVLPRLTAAFHLGRSLHKLGRFLRMGSVDDFILYSGCNVLPVDLAELGMSPSSCSDFRRQVLAEAKVLYPGEPLRQAMYNDQHTYLPSLLMRNDRMTMGASIECRLPFLDYRLVEGLAALPSSVLLAGRKKKALLRQSMARRLPPSVQRHRKQGFSVPWQSYLRETPGLRALVSSLPEMRPIADGPFDRARIRRVVQDFLLGDNRQRFLVENLLMITVWYQASLGAGTLRGSETIGTTP
jgi:asparagine synthase (glutamine-hydrolysing)